MLSVRIGPGEPSFDKLRIFMYYLYILKSTEGKYYTGITKNLSKRLSQHQTGFGAQYTKRDFFKLVFSEEIKNRLDAEKRESQIKGWTKVKKEAMINKDFSLLRRLSKNHGLNEGLSGAE